MKNSIFRFLALLFVVATAGFVGGLVGRLWVAEFEIDGPDKLDIFVGLLAGTLTVMALAFGGFGLSLFSWLNHVFESKTNELSQEFTTKSEKLDRELETKAEDIKGELNRTSRLNAHKAQVWSMLKLSETMFRWGTVSSEADGRAAAHTFSLALDVADDGRSLAEEYLTGADDWERTVITSLNNLVVWLGAHLERKDRIEPMYRQAAELEQGIKGNEDNEWKIAETCNYLRFKLPRKPGDKAAALDHIRTLLERTDIDDAIRRLLRKYYGLPMST